jgi:hypothetical protein
VRCTPGAINPDVTEATIGKTICVPGWTAKIRPPVAYTNLLKTSQMIEYGETGLPSDFEEDHLINLGIGGAPQDPDNLFPQPRTGPRSATVKDQEETQLQRDVCTGRTTLTAAQARSSPIGRTPNTGSTLRDRVRLQHRWIAVFTGVGIRTRPRFLSCRSRSGCGRCWGLSAS